MQTVSKAWKNNQRSYIRAEGYPTITIDGVAVELDQMSEMRHSRSYDPMGLELPTNTIEIDLFNYNDRYLDTYKAYKGERKKVVLTYSYKLSSGTETIPGGVFWTTDMELNNKMLTIRAADSLSIANSEVIVSESAPLKNTVVFSGEKTNLTIDDFAYTIPTYKFSSIIEKIKNDTGLSINYNSRVGNINAQLYYAYEQSAIELLQYIANMSLARFVINRTDGIELTDISSTVSTTEDILLINTMDEPELSMSKYIKSVRTNSKQIKYDVNNVSSQSKSIAGKETATSSDITNITRIFECDYTQNKLVSIEIEQGHSSRLHTVQKVEEGVFTYKKNTDDEGEEFITTKAYAITYNRYRKYDMTITANFAPFTTEVTEETTYHDIGEVCDIDNPLGKPVSLEKVRKYYENREIYDLYIRGNPARDVGDYVKLSLEDDNDIKTYKDALVIASEIVYDGTFKEYLTVRIINTQFETTTIKDGVLRLSDYTHDQLSAKTHNQLTDYVHG